MPMTIPPIHIDLPLVRFLAVGRCAAFMHDPRQDFQMVQTLIKVN